MIRAGDPDREPTQPGTGHALEAHLGAFGAHLEPRRPPLCPELELWLLGDGVDLEGGCEALRDDDAPPYWAFAWGSGQALARWVLDHPDRVRGRDVVDLGTGSGIVAIAAARAGARRVTAIDLDPIARRAAALNARHNGVEIRTDARTPASWDLLLAADVLYETGLRGWLLGAARDAGPLVVADPERTGTPRLDFPILDRVAARTLPDVDSPRRSVVLHEVPPRSPAALR